MPFEIADDWDDDALMGVDVDAIAAARTSAPPAGPSDRDPAPGHRPAPRQPPPATHHHRPQQQPNRATAAAAAPPCPLNPPLYPVCPLNPSFAG